MHSDRLRFIALRAALVSVAVVLAQTVQQVIAPQRNGLLVLGQILAPHLFVAVIAIAGPLALLRGPAPTKRVVRVLRLAVVLLALVGVVRYGAGSFSLPRSAPAGSAPVEIMSWNLEATGSGVPGLLELLRGSSARVIGLQELRRSDAALLDADVSLAERYPSMILRPRDGSTGIGLLSAFPIVASGWLDDPSAIWARLDIGDGRTLLAITAHPLPATIVTLGVLPLPVDYDATARDAAITRLRHDIVDAQRIGDEPLVLFGDLNVTDREPAYADLSAGFDDAHADVGLGPGSTWRPPLLEWLPFGLLRIDHVFAGGRADPLSISTDCTPRGSDHCIVNATVAVGP